MEGYEKETQMKEVGEFRVAFYPGLGNTFSVVRAWRVGTNPRVIRDEPYPSWQIYEGDYDEALALYKFLETGNEIERRCNPLTRNPMITRTEEIREFNVRYAKEPPKNKKNE